MNNHENREANRNRSAIEIKDYVVHESQDIPTNDFTMINWKKYFFDISSFLQMFLVRISQHLRQPHPDSTDPPLWRNLYGNDLR